MPRHDVMVTFSPREHTINKMSRVMSDPAAYTNPGDLWVGARVWLLANSLGASSTPMFERFWESYVYYASNHRISPPGRFSGESDGFLMPEKMLKTSFSFSRKRRKSR